MTPRANGCLSADTSADNVLAMLDFTATARRGISRTTGRRGRRRSTRGAERIHKELIHGLHECQSRNDVLADIGNPREAIELVLDQLPDAAEIALDIAEVDLAARSTSFCDR